MLPENGRWDLAPAFDVTYAHNPMPGKWTANQQLAVKGKRNDITREDMISAGRNCDVATLPKLKRAFEQVVDALGQWKQFATQAGVRDDHVRNIGEAIGYQQKSAGG